MKSFITFDRQGAVCRGVAVSLLVAFCLVLVVPSVFADSRPGSWEPPRPYAPTQVDDQQYADSWAEERRPQPNPDKAKAATFVFGSIPPWVNHVFYRVVKVLRISSILFAEQEGNTSHVSKR